MFQQVDRTAFDAVMRGAVETFSMLSGMTVQQVLLEMKAGNEPIRNSVMMLMFAVA
jgi:hypothetical protein